MSVIDLNTLLELVGSLNDNTEPGSASARFRKYLSENVVQASDVRDYVHAALSRSGDQYNKALQDLINHLGGLLGFDVTFGRYRGAKGQVGFDGFWQSPSGWAIVVETKTTDAYSVPTATLLGYINHLVSAGRITDTGNALGLYVYGRFDSGTSQLENAITVENRKDRLRVVSVDALLSLLQLKQQYQLDHQTILRLLLPAPIRVDPLVDLIRNIVAQEQEKEADADARSLWIEEPVTSEEKIRPPAAGRKAAAPSSERRGRKSVLLRSPQDLTGKEAKAVVFHGERQEIATWKEGFLWLCKALVQRDRARFMEVAPTLVGTKRPYITADKGLLRVSELIPDTTLYFETNLSANYLAMLGYTLIQLMGYNESDLRFEHE